MRRRVEVIIEHVNPAENAQLRSIAEIDSYRDIDLDEEHIHSCDLMTWWLNQNQLPGLQRLALMVLSIPATSSSVEGSFSTAGQILNKYRTRLSDENLEAIMLL